MPLPSVTFRSELDPVVRKELDQFDGELTGYLLEEHDDDGHHTRITADAVTVDGPVTINGGPLLIDGVPITGGDEVKAHAPTHAVGGSDPVSVTGLAGYPGGTTTFLRADRNFAALPATAPTPHGASHAAGAADPVTVTALAGYPGGAATFLRADATFAALPATSPTPHHLSHEPGGADPLSNVAWTNLANTFITNQRCNGQVAANTFAADLWASAISGYYERNRPAPMGEWQNQPFNAADYAASAGGGTWTVTAAALVQSRYMLIGKTLFWAFYYSWWNAGANVITGNVTAITIKVPGGYSCPSTHTQTIDWGIDGPRVDLDVVAAGTTITVTKRSGAAFTPGGSVGLVATIMFEVS